MTLTSDLHRHWPAIVQAVRAGLTVPDGAACPLIQRTPFASVADGGTSVSGGYTFPNTTSSVLTTTTATHTHKVRLSKAALAAPLLATAPIEQDATLAAQWSVQWLIANTRKVLGPTLPVDPRLLVPVLLFPDAGEALRASSTARAGGNVATCAHRFRFDAHGLPVPTDDLGSARVPLALLAPRPHRALIRSLAPWTLGWEPAGQGVDLVLEERVLLPRDVAGVVVLYANESPAPA